MRFAWRELFNPLGMRDVTLEFDGFGTLQGSSYMLASARDWARFGLLYLQDGVVGGRKILHEDWVDLSAAATLDTDYGAGFWTNRSEHERAKGRIAMGIPRDAFFAFGDLGQRIVILQSQRMVIVRLGDSVDPTGDIRGLGRLVKEVIAATQRVEAVIASEAKQIQKPYTRKDWIASSQALLAMTESIYRPTIYGPPFSSARA